MFLQVVLELLVLLEDRAEFCLVLIYNVLNHEFIRTGLSQVFGIDLQDLSLRQRHVRAWLRKTLAVLRKHLGVLFVVPFAFAGVQKVILFHVAEFHDSMEMGELLQEYLVFRPRGEGLFFCCSPEL